MENKNVSKSQAKMFLYISLYTRIIKILDQITTSRDPSLRQPQKSYQETTAKNMSFSWTNCSEKVTSPTCTKDQFSAKTESNTRSRSCPNKTSSDTVTKGSKTC